MVPRERSRFGWPALLWLMPAWPQQWPVAKVLVDVQLQLAWICLFKCRRQPQEVWTPWNREFERGSSFFLSSSVSCPPVLYPYFFYILPFPSSSLKHPSPGDGFPIMLHFSRSSWKIKMWVSASLTTFFFLSFLHPSSFLLFIVCFSSFSSSLLFLSIFERPPTASPPFISLPLSP